MPRASSRSSSSACLSCSRASARSGERGRDCPRSSPSTMPQLERERHEPLLGAVVQVALQSPALGVAGLDDARARARELVVGVGVGQGLRDELGEVQQPPLGAGRQAARLAWSRRPARPTACRRRRAERRPRTGSPARAAARRARRARRRSRRCARDRRCGRRGRRPSRRRGRATSRAACPPGRRPASCRRPSRARRSRSAARWRSGRRSRRATSSVTRSKTALGGASLATSVAMRRRAACSSARARVARSLATRRCSASRRCGDVAQRRDDALGPAAGVEDGRRADRDPAGVPSGAQRAVSGACGRRDRAPRRPGAGRGDRLSSASTAAPRTSSGRRPRSASRSQAEDLLGGRVAVGDDPARVADDEALGHRLHHRPQSLLVGAQRLVGARALGGDRGEHERRQRRGGQEQLARQQAVGDRLADERARVVRGVPDREPRHDDERRGRPAGPEAQRGPDERREDDVGDVALGRQLGQQHEGGPAARRPRAGPGARTAASRGVAQVRISGVTTSAPEKSDSHHVRQTSPNSSAGMTSPSRSDVVPKLALISVPTAAAATSANTSPTRSMARAAADQAAQEHGGDDHLERVADGLAEHRAQRRREVATSRSPMTMPGHSRGP